MTSLRAEIREGVLEGYIKTLTAQFIEWSSKCSGNVNVEGDGNGDDIAVYFENEEDRVLYLLTFDEISELISYKGKTGHDGAFFYCPYIPISASNAKI